MTLSEPSTATTLRTSGGTLNPALVPTPLVTEEESQARQVKIVPVRGVGRFAVLRLALRVLGFGLGLGLRRVTRRSGGEAAARRTRDFLEDLGGLWIKAGQIISLRTDLLSPEMADQLSQLSHRAYGFAPDIARRVVERSLGRPIDDEFVAFEDSPFAAASISQVHRARLRGSGQVVAVKVQRPDIGAIFNRDIKLIRLLFSMMKRVPQVRHIAWDSTFREIQRIMEEEVDYRFEISNLRRMRATLREHNVHVPKVYRRLSSDHIITMEYVDGVLMSDLARVLQEDRSRASRWCAENNIRLKKVGSRLMRSFYRQLFEDVLFHGDLHPGNIVLLRDSRFALIDFGTIGTVEAKLMEYYRMMSLAFSEGDYSKAMDYFLLQADSVPLIDFDAFKADAVTFYRNWESFQSLPGVPYYEKSVTGGAATDFAQVTQRYKIAPSYQFLRVTRALGTLDANLGVLLGNTNPNTILRRYFEEYRRRALRRLRQDGPTKVAQGVNEARMSLAMAAGQLRQQAVRVGGIHRKVDAVVQTIATLIRLLLFGALVVTVYDFVDLHWPGVVRRFGPIPGLDIIARRIPPYDAGWALAIVVFLIYVARQAGLVARRYREPAVTLPAGRVEPDA